MEGVGEIYAYYRDGWLTADADVALLHGAADDGYRPLSWPMVNVRATVAALADEGAVTDVEADALLGVAEEVHFSRRTRAMLARSLAATGTDAGHAEKLAALVEERYVDQKAADARDAFGLLARLDDVPPPDRDRPRHLGGRGFDTLLYSDVTLPRRPGPVRGYQVVDDLALHDPDFEALLHRAVDRNLVVHLAADLGHRPTDDELASTRDRLLRSWGVGEDDLPDWLAGSDLDQDRLEGLVLHQALHRRMRRWMLDGVALERNRRMVIEQLQLEGRYAAAADAAARRRRWADARPVPPQPSTVPEVVDLVAHQQVAHGWAPDTVLPEYADEMGFDSLGGLYIALADARAASEEQQERRARMSRVLGLGGAGGPGPATVAHAMIEAHQVTHVVVAAVELGVPAALAEGAAGTDDLAVRLGLDAGRLGRLMTALKSLGLVARVDGGWQLTEQGRALPSLTAYAEHVRDELLGTWSGLADAIRGTRPATYPTGDGADASIDAAADGLGIGAAVADALDLTGVRRIADLGGGLGRLAEELVRRHDDVRAVVVELPGTAARAAERFAGLDVGDRLEAVTYDARARLEPPVDLALLVRVLATLDDDEAVRLLELARRSLAPGGRIEVFEPEADGTPAAALTDLLNLVRSAGAVRTPDGWRDLATRAGLRTVSRTPFLAPFAHFTFVPAEEAP
jgi:SAM-dependent methyltransferase